MFIICVGLLHFHLIVLFSLTSSQISNVSAVRTHNYTIDAMLKHAQYACFLCSIQIKHVVFIIPNANHSRFTCTISSVPRWSKVMIGDIERGVLIENILLLSVSYAVIFNIIWVLKLNPSVFWNIGIFIKRS